MANNDNNQSQQTVDDNTTHVQKTQSPSYKNYATSNSLNIRPVKIDEIKTKTIASNKSGKERNYQYNGSHPAPRTKKINAKQHESLFLANQQNNSTESSPKDNKSKENQKASEVLTTTTESLAVHVNLNDLNNLDDLHDDTLNKSQGRVNPDQNRPKHIQLPNLNQPNGSHAVIQEDNDTRWEDSNLDDEKLTSFKKLGAVLLATIVLVTWVKSDTLSSYWHQSYDGSEILDNVAQSDIGKVGNAVDNTAKQHTLQESLGYLNQSINTEANAVFYDENSQHKSDTSSDNNSQNIDLTSLTGNMDNIDNTNNYALGVNSANGTRNTADTSSTPLPSTYLSSSEPIQHISIQQGEKAFFIGDSLMQGVAPWVMRDLQKTHKIDSINLSKHSTGLTFAKFFDWPSTVNKTLTENPDITAIFVFLGGNDGQSIIDPNTQRHVRFGRERWDEIYSENINKILTLAKQHNVQVLWVTTPSMRSKSLNNKMGHLSQLYSREVVKQGIVINSNKVLQLDTEHKKYSDSITVDGKRIKVRTSDGVHFTTKGQKYLAKAILDKIHVNDTTIQPSVMTQPTRLPSNSKPISHSLGQGMVNVSPSQ